MGRRDRPARDTAVVHRAPRVRVLRARVRPQLRRGQPVRLHARRAAAAGSRAPDQRLVRDEDHHVPPGLLVDRLVLAPVRSRRLGHRHRSVRRDDRGRAVHLLADAADRRRPRARARGLPPAPLHPVHHEDQQPRGQLHLRQRAPALDLRERLPARGHPALRRRPLPLVGRPARPGRALPRQLPRPGRRDLRARAPPPPLRVRRPLVEGSAAEARRAARPLHGGAPPLVAHVPPLGGAEGRGRGAEHPLQRAVAPPLRAEGLRARLLPPPGLAGAGARRRGLAPPRSRGTGRAARRGDRRDDDGRLGWDAALDGDRDPEGRPALRLALLPVPRALLPAPRVRGHRPHRARAQAPPAESRAPRSPRPSGAPRRS